MQNSLILANLSCSGASAIDPILRKLLKENNYFVPPISEMGPHTPGKLGNYLAENQQFYAWIHADIHSKPRLEKMKSFFKSKNKKFIFLYRDPRDVLVSFAHVYKHDTKSEDSIELIMKQIILDQICSYKSSMKYAHEWLRIEDEVCLKLTFNEIKDDMLKSIKKIEKHLGINFGDINIKEAIDQFTFEKQHVGYKRGQTQNQLTRSEYAVRSGTSGKWKLYFNEELESLYKKHILEYSIKLGFQ